MKFATFAPARALLVSTAVLSFGSLGFAATVLSNNASPGDSFSNDGGSNQGQAISGSGWYYNNVRNNGIAGVDTTYARSGNGSAYLSTTQGPGGASSKADVEYLAGGTNVGGNYYATSSLGALGNLNLGGLGYEWYRDSTSTNTDLQHPSFRILLDADGDLSTTGDRGGLVFERAYNGGGAVPTDTWVSDSVTGSTKVWNFGLGIGNEYGGFGNTLQSWIDGVVNSAVSSNSAVLGFSSGVGSGWGPFVGAVDNIRFGFGSSSTTYNFETSSTAIVPLPAAAWMGMALMSSVGGVSFLRNRKRVA